MAMLAALTPDELDALAADAQFVTRVVSAAAELDEYLTQPRWYQRLEGSKPAAIGYFSPEFGITAVLPQYSGGLGILAGDHLKSASDLGVPIIGVGLLYQKGYFRQVLSLDGWQKETYPDNDWYNMPVCQEIGPDGKPRSIEVDLDGERVVRDGTLTDARPGKVVK